MPIQTAHAPSDLQAKRHAKSVFFGSLRIKLHNQIVQNAVAEITNYQMLKLLFSILKNGQ